MSSLIIHQIVEKLEALPDELQRRVLEYTNSLSNLQILGTPSQKMMRFAGTLSPEDAQRMLEAIEAGCEQVESDGWE